MTEQFKWVDYYEEFASKLLEYRNNRKEEMIFSIREFMTAFLICVFRYVLTVLVSACLRLKINANTWNRYLRREELYE